MSEIAAKTTLDNEQIIADFPILNQMVNGHKLVYLDNAASSQKPQSVIDSLSEYYHRFNSNVHRGVHHLSQLATDQFEQTRKKVQQLINAPENREVIITKGTTESINLIAQSFSVFLKAGDEILISGMEHHSNIVPWQMLCERTGAVLKVIPVTPAGELDMESFYQLLSDRTKFVSVVHVSNALGTVNPVEEIIEAAHKCGARVLIDGAQAVPHTSVDVQKLNCDFYTFSAHKMYGPTGVGILYGRSEILEQMPPYQGGGEMIREVSFDKTTYNDLPFKFEAGTPNIAGGIAFGAALDYINKVGYPTIEHIETSLVNYALERLAEVDGIKFIGNAKNRASVVSFLIEGTHPYDVGAIIDKLGIAVRTGHHCTQPLMKYFGIPGTIRASFAMYNSLEDVDKLTEGVKRAAKMLR